MCVSGRFILLRKRDKWFCTMTPRDLHKDAPLTLKLRWSEKDAKACHCERTVQALGAYCAVIASAAKQSPNFFIASSSTFLLEQKGGAHPDKGRDKRNQRTVLLCDASVVISHWRQSIYGDNSNSFAIVD
jgi:hypothetical protein